MRYFVAVAEELHFGRAARRLRIAQPPLSQQIRVLEDELGTALFIRSRRMVALTEAGRLLLPEARATLGQAARAAETARAAGQGERGRLVIGFVTSACYTVLPGAVRRFRERYPGVEIHLKEMIPAEQVSALARREIDVGLLRPPVEHAEVHSIPVLREPLVAALPSGHAKAGKAWLDLKVLAGEPLALFPRRHGPGLIDAISAACHTAGFVCAPTYEPNDMQSILAHVAAGLAVSIVPASLRCFHAEAIRYLPIRRPRMTIDLHLAWSASAASAAAVRFRDIVQNEMSAV